jgi:hypothetical protein
MISTRSVGLVIDTVVCLTLDKWETVSGQFGGYLIGREESAIPLNVLAMAPYSGTFEVNHPPSPLWMFLSCLLDWIGELAAAQIAWTNERSSPGLEYG